MLALLLLGSMQIQQISEWGYSEKFDIKLLRHASVYGVVTQVSRLRIELQTLDPILGVKPYPTHRRLSHGLYPYTASEGNAYRVADVQLGDFVTLHLCNEAKTEYCFLISIHRRPGGLVPESCRPRAFASYAEHQNAHNAFKDKGIPIPRYLVRRSPYEYPFADPEIPKEKRLARWPKADPFSYFEFALFMR